MIKISHDHNHQSHLRSPFCSASLESIIFGD
jgi:hypothetical protein